MDVSAQWQRTEASNSRVPGYNVLTGEGKLARQQRGFVICLPMPCYLPLARWQDTDMTACEQACFLPVVSENTEE